MMMQFFFTKIVYYIDLKLFNFVQPLFSKINIALLYNKGLKVKFFLCCCMPKNWSQPSQTPHWAGSNSSSRQHHHSTREGWRKCPSFKNFQAVSVTKSDERKIYTFAFLRDSLTATINLYYLAKRSVRNVGIR